MIVGVGCWRGRGATTAALLLGAALAENGSSPWLIEADAAGGVLAVRCGLGADDVGGPQGIGVERLTRAAVPVAPVDQFAGAAIGVGAVRLVPMPADPFRAHACLTTRAAWIASLDQLDELDGPVVVDVGRLRSGAIAWSLVGRLDVLLLVTSAETVDLVSSDEWAATGGRITATDTGLAPDAVRLVVVDAPCAGATFARSVVETEVRQRLAGWIPWAPAAVDLVHRGVGLDDRRVRRAGFAAAVRRLAVDVVTTQCSGLAIEEVGA